MKAINKLVWTFSLFAIFFTVTNSASAGFWGSLINPFKGPNKNIQTLIITGNYAESRLLAELIQKANKQPILLTPATANGKIFFVPPPSRAKPLAIKNEELTNFINFVGAKQIIILGNKNYVPNKYTKEIGANQIVWRLTGDNWKKVAASVGKLLNLTNVSSDYETLFTNLKSEVNYKREGQNEADLSLQMPDSDIAITPTAEKPILDQQSNTEPIELIDASQK